MKANIGILMEGYYLPDTKKSVQKIFSDEDVPFGTLAKKIDFRRDIGIEEVYVTDELASALALRAAQHVVSMAGLSGSEIDLIIDFTSIPQDYIGPTWSAAGLIQKELDAKHAFCTAITSGGCASYHFALRSAIAIMHSDENINTVLLVAGDRTPEFNKTYYPITVASDAGSALVLKKGSDRGVILAIDTISVGSLHVVWYVPGLDQRECDDSVTDKLLQMHCDLEKFIEGVIPRNFFMFGKIIRKVLAKAEMAIDDIDYFIYPTFSTWDQEYFCEATGVLREKVYTKSLRLRGHTQESDMVINYADAVEEGLIKKGDVVMVISNGAGFAWSAAIVRH
jgi:3-oxoacyl-[acyl-carrier-protein] synthase-3